MFETGAAQTGSFRRNIIMTETQKLIIIIITNRQSSIVSLDAVV